MYTLYIYIYIYDTYNRRTFGRADAGAYVDEGLLTHAQMMPFH